MFNLFKNREYVAPVKTEEPVPYVEPERQYYSLGPTTENRVMLKMYYGNVSMDVEGINSLIQVLEASKAWCVDGGKEPEDTGESVV